MKTFVLFVEFVVICDSSDDHDRREAGSSTPWLTGMKWTTYLAAISSANMTRVHVKG